MSRTTRGSTASTPSFAIFIKSQPVARDIHADEDLGGLGLTSLDMVNLMLAVEAEFDVTIPGPKLVPANFRSIANIAGLVSQLSH